MNKAIVVVLLVSMVMLATIHQASPQRPPPPGDHPEGGVNADLPAAEGKDSIWGVNQDENRPLNPEWGR